jgi:hypothetical protein
MTCSAYRHSVLGNAMSRVHSVYLLLRPAVPAALEQFLAPCVNRETITSEYLGHRSERTLAVRVTLPLAGYNAFLLSAGQAEWLRQQRVHLLEGLRLAPAEQQLPMLDAWQTHLPSTPIPMLLVRRIEDVLVEERHQSNTLELTSLTT